MEKFSIFGKNCITFPKEVTHPAVMELLANFTSGVNWETSYTAPANCIMIGEACEEELSDAEFVLNITEGGVYIRGKDYPSMMRGFLAFLDKIFCRDRRVYYAECCTLRETPTLVFRSVHICVFPEVTSEFLRKCIRLAAMAKYSHVILEFWGMLQFDCMKELAWAGALTKKQAKDIVQEARALGMEIVPFFQHLGHASLCRLGASGKHVVLDQNIEYEYLYMPDSYGWVWDFTREDVRELLRTVRRELMDVCGDGKYFHLGCDEAPTVCGTERAMELCAYLNEVQAELEADGRRAIMWGDMLLSQEDFKDQPRRFPGNDYFSLYEANSSKAFTNIMMEHLDKRIIIADWQYEVKNEEWMSSKMFQEKGFDVICSMYSDIPNIHTAVKSAANSQLYGAMKTTWHTLAREVPRLYYAGICMWEGRTEDLMNECNAFISEKTSQIFRKVLNPQGNYETSGWSDKQIGPGR